MSVRQYQEVLGATLTHARKWLFDTVEDGAKCPCCQQLAKLYKRNLNSGMARSLVWLVRQSNANKVNGLSPAGWVYLGKEAPAWLLRTKELATTRHWGLVELKPRDPEDTARRTSGIWRPTEKGVDFVHCRLRVPKRVHLYDNIQCGWSEEHVSVVEALGTKFDYASLMAGRG